jgi:hypothetical protein
MKVGKEGVKVHLSAQFTFCFYNFMFMLIKSEWRHALREAKARKGL